MTRDSEPKNIYRRIVNLIDGGQPFAVGLVLHVEGSAPQVAGARAAMEPTGQIWGTLGGGGVEADAQRRAIKACRGGRPIVFERQLDGASAAGPAIICGGAMRLLIDPTATKHRAAYAAAAKALDNRSRGVLLTRVQYGAEMEITTHHLPEDAVPATEQFPGSDEIGSCLTRETPRSFVDPTANRETLVEPVVPPRRLLIAGGGHVGQALARQAVLLDFDVTVIDDRQEFADSALFPVGVATRCEPVADEIAAFPLDADTYVVIVTRGHQHDAVALEACIHSPAGYLGVIGSRRKVGLLREDFIDAGKATAAEFDRVYAPIGLDIGAITPAEIAASICAQLVAVRRRGQAPRIGE